MQPSAPYQIMPSTLYLVATPIGNLEDITLRALRILKEVSLIACEDTRQTKKLLQHYNINVPTISYHDHNERNRTDQLLAHLAKGESLALVSDAGTPMLSDPGFILVRAAIAHNYSVVAVPGASALLPALTAAGLPCQDFFFAGFLPSRSSERKRRLTQLASLPTTLVFYESPHRILAMIADALEILGTRMAVIARELTKLHEEYLRGDLAQLLHHLQTNPPRGELVVVIAGREEATENRTTTESLSAAIEETMVKENIDRMAALKLLARQLGISKSEAYRRLEREKVKH